MPTTKPKPPAKKTAKAKAPEATFQAPGKTKAPAKKRAAKKTATPVADAPVAEVPAADAAPAAKTRKKAAAKTSAKPAAKTKAATKGKGVGGQSLPRVLNEHGFVVGSDSEKIVNALLEGGTDRLDINAKVAKIIGKRKTRNGNDQNVSSLIANVLRRLRDNGYRVESSWVLVAPTEEEKVKAQRAAKRRAAKKATKPSKA